MRNILVLRWKSRSWVLGVVKSLNLSAPQDVMFYFAGAGAVVAAGATPATAGARMPLLALLAVSLAGERLLVHRLHSLLGVNDVGQVRAAEACEACARQFLITPHVRNACSSCHIDRFGNEVGICGRFFLCQVLMTLPVRRWLPFLPAEVEPLTFDFKWAVRNCCMALAALIMGYRALVYRNYQHEGYR